jgi:hypothetical protein
VKLQPMTGRWHDAVAWKTQEVASDRGVRELPLAAPDFEPVSLQFAGARGASAQGLPLGNEATDCFLERADRVLQLLAAKHPRRSAWLRPTVVGCSEAY